MFCTYKAGSANLSWILEISFVFGWVLAAQSLVFDAVFYRLFFVVLVVDFFFICWSVSLPLVIVPLVFFSFSYSNNRTIHLRFTENCLHCFLMVFIHLKQPNRLWHGLFYRMEYIQVTIPL